MPAVERIGKLTPTLATEPVSHDPDDPAIWVNPKNRAESLLLGTNKASAAEGGSLYAFTLSGNVRKIVKGLDRPNNVVVVESWAVVTERLQNRLRVFQLPSLKEVGQIPTEPLPMGIAAWGRSVLVSFKQSAVVGPLVRYQLVQERGRVAGRMVGRLGRFSGKKEIEAIAVDPRRGRVYYADEGVGVRVWENGRERARIATDFQGDQEGIALWGRYVVCNEQRLLAEGGSRLHLYDQDTLQRVVRMDTGADETDGIELQAGPLGPRFPAGILVAMNSQAKNFLVYDLRELQQQLRVKR